MTAAVHALSILGLESKQNSRDSQSRRPRGISKRGVEGQDRADLGFERRIVPVSSRRHLPAQASASPNLTGAGNCRGGVPVFPEGPEVLHLCRIFASILQLRRRYTSPALGKPAKRSPRSSGLRCLASIIGDLGPEAVSGLYDARISSPVSSASAGSRGSLARLSGRGEPAGYLFPDSSQFLVMLFPVLLRVELSLSRTTDGRQRHR